MTEQVGVMVPGSDLGHLSISHVSNSSSDYIQPLQRNSQAFLRLRFSKLLLPSLHYVLLATHQSHNIII